MIGKSATYTERLSPLVEVYENRSSRRQSHYEVDQRWHRRGRDLSQVALMLDHYIEVTCGGIVEVRGETTNKGHLVETYFGVIGRID